MGRGLDPSNSGINDDIRRQLLSALANDMREKIAKFCLRQQEKTKKIKTKSKNYDRKKALAKVKETVNGLVKLRRETVKAKDRARDPYARAYIGDKVPKGMDIHLYQIDGLQSIPNGPQILANLGSILGEKNSTDLSKYGDHFKGSKAFFNKHGVLVTQPIIDKIIANAKKEISQREEQVTQAKVGTPEPEEISPASPTLESVAVGKEELKSIPEPEPEPEEVKEPKVDSSSIEPKSLGEKPSVLRTVEPDKSEQFDLSSAGQNQHKFGQVDFSRPSVRDTIAFINGRLKEGKSLQERTTSVEKTISSSVKGYVVSPREKISALLAKDPLSRLHDLEIENTPRLGKGGREAG